MIGSDDEPLPGAGKSAPDRRFNQLVTAAALLPAGCLFVPLFLPLCTGRVFALDDLAAFHLPLRTLYAAALADGQSILWTPYLFNGFYVHAEGQIGAMHPLHLALYRLVPVGAAFNLELAFSYVAAFGGMCVLLRRFGATFAACVMGATAFSFSGFQLLHLTHVNAVAITAHVPWLLAALDVLLKGARTWPPAFAAISLLVGSQVLLGYPQYVWFSALTCGAYALLCARHAASWTRLPLAGAAAVLGLALGGAQLLPTIELFERSGRPEISQAFATSFSLHPLNLLQLWSPYLFAGRVYAVPGERFIHEFGVYNGALCSLAVICVALRGRQLFLWPQAAYGLALCALGFVLALGKYGVVYEYLTALPLIGSFRAPARYLFLVHLGLSLLLAVAVDDLIRHPGTRRRPALRVVWIWGAFALSVLTAVGVWIAPALLAAPSGASPVRAGTIAGVALVGIATWLVRDAGAGSRSSLLVLPMFAALDLGVWGYSYVWASPPRSIAAIANEADVPPSFARDTTVHFTTRDASRNLALLRGLKVFRPYVGLAPSLALTAETEDVLRLGGVEWVQERSGWSRVRNPMPRVRLLSDALRSPDPARDLQQIDISRTALVSDEIPPLGENQDAAVRVIADEPGQMVVSVSAASRAILVTTERYHEGWVAVAGGRTLPTLLVYGDYLGVLVEPGQYDLTVRFHPRSARSGIILSLATLIVMLAVLLAGRIFPFIRPSTLPWLPVVSPGCSRHRSRPGNPPPRP